MFNAKTTLTVDHRSDIITL